MPRILLVCEYDGTDFAGYQSQKNGRTVQDVLAKACSGLYEKQITLTGCSRTDAGVHARCHLSHADVPFFIPEENVPLALNSRLPGDLSVRRAMYVRDDFSARTCVLGKRYVYRIYTGRTPSPLHARYMYFCPHEPDVSLMNEEAKAFAGEHDFAAFCAAGSSQKTTVRRLTGVVARRDASHDNIIEIEVTGEAFLYNMVRIIAGTLLDLGIGRADMLSVADIIRSCDRQKAGRTLPAKGLTLEEVFFDEPSARNYNI